MELFYKKLIRTSHNSLSLQLENSDVCPETLAMINKLVEILPPSTFKEHCDLVRQIEDCVKRMAYIPGNVFFTSEFRYSSLAVLRDKINNDNEKEQLELQGHYAPFPFLLLPNENVNPTLDINAACLEMLEINRFILDEFIEEFGFIHENAGGLH